MKKERGVVAVQNAIEKALNIILLVISLFFLCVGVYALVDHRLVIKDAEIPDDFKQSAIADRQYPDIKKLQETNKEIVAWLTIDNTPVDYPITKFSDNVKYLAKNYKSEYSLAGNPFVDYRNDFLKDDYTVIYGHRMNQKKMFGSLIEYGDASYMQSHLTGSITTTEGTRKLEVLLYSIENIKKTKAYDLVEMRNNNNVELLKSLSKNATTVNGKYSRDDLKKAEVGQWDLLLLSTCDKDSQHYRDILLLKIGDEI